MFSTHSTGAIVSLPDVSGKKSPCGSVGLFVDQVFKKFVFPDFSSAFGAAFNTAIVGFAVCCLGWCSFDLFIANATMNDYALFACITSALSGAVMMLFGLMIPHGNFDSDAAKLTYSRHAHLSVFRHALAATELSFFPGSFSVKRLFAVKANGGYPIHSGIVAASLRAKHLIFIAYKFTSAMSARARVDALRLSLLHLEGLTVTLCRAIDLIFVSALVVSSTNGTIFTVISSVGSHDFLPIEKHYTDSVRNCSLGSAGTGIVPMG